MQSLTSIRRALGTSLISILMTIGGNAFAAGAGAVFIDICANGQEGLHPYPCEGEFNELKKQRVVVSITQDAQHVGRIGAFYVGVRTDGQIRGNFTTKGWTGWSGGLFEPVALFESLPGSNQQYVVLDGGLVCPQIGGGTSELWAGYGILNDNSAVMLKNYKNYLSKGMTYEHLVRTYVQHEMSESERAWKVLEINCPVGNSDDNN